MLKNSHTICLFMLSAYGFIDAKVVDIHLSNPVEEHMINQAHKEQEIEANLNIVWDDSQNEAERRQALKNLAEIGGIS